MHGYKQLEHTADIAIEIYADSIENLFRAGSEAWYDLSVEGEPADSSGKKNFRLKAASYEELLIVFLSELNYQLQAYKWLAQSISSISIYQKEKDFFIDADIEGDTIDFDKFYIKEEIKAVTFHQVNIENKDELFTTKIVFDI